MIATTSNYTMMVTAVTLLGMTCTIRLQVFCNYLNENCVTAHYAKALTIAFSIEGFMKIPCSLYMLYISTNAYHLIYSSLAVQTVAALLSTSFLESPRFLIKTGQLDRA